MFDITIGTMIPAVSAITMIPQLNELGFESYELDFNGVKLSGFDFDSYGEKLQSVLDGRRISACGTYRNPILNADDRKELTILIKNLKKLNCSVMGTFAGGNPELSVPANIPGYVNTWKPLAELAGENGVKIGFEGCGGGWHGGSHNISYCSASWELMFSAIDTPVLGLEWEPCHALERLADPIPQLRRFAKKIVHIHGKDATVAWDVLRDYGTDSGMAYIWDRTPGFGDTNWADIFTILIQNGYTGGCDIEGYHDPVHYDDMEWTAQVTALDYLKRCRGGIDYIPGPTEYRGYQGTRKK